MDMKLQGKVALVTGASAGIGFATARGLLEEGCKLVICGRNSERLEKATTELRSCVTTGEVLSVQADAQQEDAVERLVQVGVEHFGGIDILVNNSEGAAFVRTGMESITDAEWQEAFNSKLMGYIRLTRLVLPAMKERGWGKIINVIGTSGKEPMPALIKSGAANAALMNFTSAVARECASNNVQVTGINPGIIETPRNRQYLRNAAIRDNCSEDDVKHIMAQNIPAGRLGQSEEVADVIVFLASSRSSYLSGVTIPVDGGMSASAF